MNRLIEFGFLRNVILLFNQRVLIIIEYPLLMSFY